MAAEVLSGTGNIAYTNNTGQNVRIVINFLGLTSSNGRCTLSWGSASHEFRCQAIGRNLAFVGSSTYPSINAYGGTGTVAPTELMLAPSQTFSATIGAGTGDTIAAYNVVVIPEGG